MWHGALAPGVGNVGLTVAMSVDPQWLPREAPIKKLTPHFEFFWVAYYLVSIVKIRENLCQIYVAFKKSPMLGKKKNEEERRQRVLRPTPQLQLQPEVTLKK